MRVAITGSQDRLLRSRGQFGIARAAEALGNLDEAIEEYKKVIEINESEAMNKKAEERIDVLSKPETKAFVSWFADQDFSPPDPSLPPRLPSGEALPELPDFSLPPLNLGTQPGGAPRDLDGGIELPADRDAPMNEEAPAKEEQEIVLPDIADPSTTTETESTPTETPSPEQPPTEASPEEPSTEQPSTAGESSEVPADEPASDQSDDEERADQ